MKYERLGEELLHQLKQTHRKRESKQAREPELRYAIRHDVLLHSGGLNAPLQIVSQRTIDGYASSTPNQPRLIAVSGTSFRVFPDPGGGAYTATLRYYQKLATPAGATVNAILTGSPDVYLYGCLVEASIFTQDEPGALRYLALYNASVAGLNARTQRITGSSVPVIRVRAGMAP